MGSQLNPDSLLEAGFTKIPKSSILDENEEEKMKISNAKEKKKKRKIIKEEKHSQLQGVEGITPDSPGKTRDSFFCANVTTKL